MALQEKEFIVKNGLDIKNSTLKLNGVSPTQYQFPLKTLNGNLGWAKIESGPGIIVTQSDDQIKVQSSGTASGALINVGDLSVGVNATWSSNGSAITVTYADHGLVATNSVFIIWTTGASKPSNGNYTVATVPTSGTFTITNALASGNSGTCTLGGNITAKRDFNVSLSATVGTTLTVGSTATVGTSLTITGTPSLIATTLTNPVSIFNTTTAAINLATASNSLSVGSASSVTTFNGSISHKGITLTSGIASSQKVDTLYQYATSALILTTSWLDSGISGSTQLMTGVYYLRLRVAATNEFYVGVVPWYSGNGAVTINDDYTEINMYKFGDGGNASSVYLRIYRTASAAPKIQLSASTTLSSQIYNFSFRKLID